jgi:putative transposase
MDGKGAWRDNVFVERLWRSVKYEKVYLRAYDSVSDARASIDRYFDPTSPSCHSAWQPNPGRRSTYRGGKSVQTTGTTSGRPMADDGGVDSRTTVVAPRHQR